MGRRGGALAAILAAVLAGGAPAAPADRGHDASARPATGMPGEAGAPQGRDVAALAFDAGGALLAADRRAGTVVRLGAGGETLGTFGAGRLDDPAGVAVEPDGDVLVADALRVHRFAAGGSPDVPVASLAVPRAAGLAAAPDGTVYVAAPDRVLRLSAAGAPMAEWRADDVRGVAVAADGTVWVTVEEGVGRFTADGVPLGMTPADRPEGVAAAADGTVLVAEDDHIVRLAADGHRLEKIQGDLDEPRAVALGCRGVLAVSDDSRRPIHRLAVAAGPAAACPAPVAAAGVLAPPAAPTPAAPDVPAPVAGETDRPAARRPAVVPEAAAAPAGRDPVAGRTAVAEPLSGTVIARLPGRRGVIVLRSVTPLPTGTRIDTRGGRVRLTFATRTPDFPRLGTTQTADVDSGVFSIHQARGRSGVLLRLEGAGPSCGRAAYGRPLGPRHLWVDARGAVTTSGRNARASARDARWLTEDRCEGTLVRVTRGGVHVRGRASRGAVRLGAGAGRLTPPART
jgi:hypothetical protein